MTEFDLEALRGGNRRALAKAITLIESILEADREQAQQLLEQALLRPLRLNLKTSRDTFL